MAKTESQLAVVEGKWDKRTNVSVRSLFDVLTDINFGTPHAYIYEMFCDGHSLSNIIERMGADKQVRYLYIGAHGSNGLVFGLGGSISKTNSKTV